MQIESMLGVLVPAPMPSPLRESDVVSYIQLLVADGQVNCRRKNDSMDESKVNDLKSWV